MNGKLSVLGFMAIAIALGGVVLGGQRSKPDQNPGRVTEIRGLVVMQASDGRYHGQSIDLIAAPTGPQGQSDFRLLGTVGLEMETSFNEAQRLFKLRHPNLTDTRTEVSFGDKYSSKDGGSAGAAFALLMLASVGDFEINPDAAMTGDVTIDGKVRQVGEVPAKVHGATLDHCQIVAIPASNAADMDDAELLSGPSVLWETQVFSVATIDEAIAIMRRNPDARMSQARELFDQLRTDFADKPVSDLAKPEVESRLEKILQLAPNHVSAAGLLRLAEGKGPSHLNVNSTIEQAVLDAGTMADGLNNQTNASSATPDAVSHAHDALQGLSKIADPSAAAVVSAMDDYCATYGKWASQQHTSKSNGGTKWSRKKKGSATSRPEVTTRDDVRDAASTVKAAITRVIADPTVIDRMLHS